MKPPVRQFIENPDITVTAYIARRTTQATSTSSTTSSWAQPIWSDPIAAIQRYPKCRVTAGVTAFKPRPPKWNEQVGAFVLNFNKRVTQAHALRWSFRMVGQCYLRDWFASLGMSWFTASWALVECTQHPLHGTGICEELPAHYTGRSWHGFLDLGSLLKTSDPQAMVSIAQARWQENLTTSSTAQGGGGSFKDRKL